MIETLRIIGFCILAAVGYGLVHDQVTARVCVEYFSIAHPPMLVTDSAFQLALVWGVVATWWVGLILGTGLAFAARAGSAPKEGLVSIWRRVLALMLWSGVFALMAGSAGALIEATAGMGMPVMWKPYIPPEKWTAFAFDAWAHSASYAGAALGGLWVIVQTYRRRFAKGINQ